MIENKINKLGQIWIETVLYTLIGLSLIGLTLTFVMPRINASKDIATIEQTMESLNVFQKKIDALIEGGSGNVRNIDMYLGRGELFIIPERDEIKIILYDFEAPYTEENEEVPIGKAIILTEKSQKKYKENIYITYGGVADIFYDGSEEQKKFTPVSIPYKFSVENLGDTDGNGIVEINIRQI